MPPCDRLIQAVTMRATRGVERIVLIGVASLLHAKATEPPPYSRDNREKNYDGRPSGQAGAEEPSPVSRRGDDHHARSATAARSVCVIAFDFEVCVLYHKAVARVPPPVARVARQTSVARRRAVPPGS